MKIEDVEVGMKVKLVSTLHTEEHLGYNEDVMLSVGEIGTVTEVILDESTPYYVLLQGGDYYDIRDLEAVNGLKETSIGNLTVSISLEDKQEIAKDILKIVLNDFNKVISDAITQLYVDDSEDEVDNVVEIKEANNVLDLFSDQKVSEIVEQALKEAFKETFLNSLNK